MHPAVGKCRNQADSAGPARLFGIVHMRIGRHLTTIFLRREELVLGKHIADILMPRDRPKTLVVPCLRPGHRRASPHLLQKGVEFGRQKKSRIAQPIDQRKIPFAP